jgi:hypothetical protein
MHSPFIALSWEILRQRRRLVWWVLGIVCACALLARVISGRPGVFENIEPVFWLSMLASLFLVFALVNCGESSVARNWHGFPYRLFTLPVPTWLLVASPMLLGLAAVGLVYLTWAKLIFAPLGKTIPLWPGLVLEVGVISYQALVWSLAGYRILRMIVLGLAGLVFMDIATLPAYPELLAHRPSPKLVAWLSLLLAGIALAAFFGACISLERQRRGGGRGRGRLREIIHSLADALPRRRANFSSPAAAQFWFEWRRGGTVLPMMSGALILLVFAPVSLQSRHHPEMTLWILGWLVATPVILAAVIGKTFATPDYWSAELSIPSFLSARPLPSGEIVVAKMKVAALSAATAWLTILAFLACWLPGWANTSRLADCWETLVALHSPGVAYAILALLLWAAVVLTWRGLVVSLWIGLSGNKRRMVLSSIAEIVSIVFIVWAAFRLKDSGWKNAPRNVSLIGWIFAFLVVLKLWLAAFSWNKITPRRVWRYTLLWITGTVGLVALAVLLCPDIFWLKYLVILAALLPIPIARLGLAPQSLAKNRHR